MKLTTQKEPVALGALVQMGMNAILTLLVVFSIISLTGEQTAALYATANFLVILVVSWKTRSIVYSPYTVAADPKLVLDGTKPGATPQPLDPNLR